MLVAACKALLPQYTQLVTTDLPSGPVDLAPFWDKVERAILLLYLLFIDIKKRLVFIASHAGVFGPLVLGAVGWQ